MATRIKAHFEEVVHESPKILTNPLQSVEESVAAAIRAAIQQAKLEDRNLSKQELEQVGADAKVLREQLILRREEEEAAAKLFLGHADHISEILVALNALVELGYGTIPSEYRNVVMNSLVADNWIADGTKRVRLDVVLRAIRIYIKLRQLDFIDEIMHTEFVQAVEDAALDLPSNILPTIELDAIFASAAVTPDNPAPSEPDAELANVKTASFKALVRALGVNRITLQRWLIPGFSTSDPEVERVYERLIELGMTTTGERGAKKFFIPMTDAMIKFLWDLYTVKAETLRSDLDTRDQNLSEGLEGFRLRLAKEAAKMRVKQFAEIRTDQIVTNAVEAGVEEEVFIDNIDQEEVIAEDLIQTQLELVRNEFNINYESFISGLEADIRNGVPHTPRYKLNIDRKFEPDTFYLAFDGLIEVDETSQNLAFTTSYEDIREAVRLGLLVTDIDDAAADRLVDTNFRSFVAGVCRQLSRFGKDIEFAVALRMSISLRRGGINLPVAKALMQLLPYLASATVETVCELLTSSSSREKYVKVIDRPVTTQSKPVITPIATATTIIETTAVESASDAATARDIGKRDDLVLMGLLRSHAGIKGSEVRQTGELKDMDLVGYPNLDRVGEFILDLGSGQVQAVIATINQVVGPMGLEYFTTDSFKNGDALAAAMSAIKEDIGDLLDAEVNADLLREPDATERYASLTMLLAVVNALKGRVDLETRENRSQVSIVTAAEINWVKSKTMYTTAVILSIIEALAQQDLKDARSFLRLLEELIMKSIGKGNGKKTTRVEKVVAPEISETEQKACAAVQQQGRILINKKWYILTGNSLQQMATTLTEAYLGKVEYPAAAAESVICAIILKIYGLGYIYEFASAALQRNVRRAPQHGNEHKAEVYMPAGNGSHRVYVHMGTKSNRLVGATYFTQGTDTNQVPVPVAPDSDLTCIVLGAAES